MEGACYGLSMYEKRTPDDAAAGNRVGYGGQIPFCARVRPFATGGVRGTRLD